MAPMIIFTQDTMKKDSMLFREHLPSMSQPRKMSLHDELRCKYAEGPSLPVLPQPMSTSSAKMTKRNMVSSKTTLIVCSMSTLA